MEEDHELPTYDVFINHRGPDVKRTLASLIYHALTRLGLPVFLDQQELQAGDALSSSIKTAISSASVHIAIFSETYAESPWCLNELLWMLDCHRRRIIPIFYGIQPSDLRYIHKGAYANAFDKHRTNGRVKIEVVERWIDALQKVSEISGLEFRKDEDDLGDFLERILGSVSKAVVRRELRDEPEHAVGLNEAAEDFQNKDFQNRVLNQTELRDRVMVVGIVGLGGYGKSALVNRLYNTQIFEFNRSCFLAEVSAKKDLASLQEKLLKDLLHNPNFKIGDTCQGRRYLRDRLRGLPRVLIVFDDIDDTEHIENLLLVKDVLGNGSLILVTSRDRDLLKGSRIDTLYDVKLLNVKDAQQLLCRHAFLQPKPPHDLQDLVKELVNMCGGIPLALKVLGVELRGMYDRESWRRKIESLKTQMPDNILQKVLKVSYDSLDDILKDAFLDIAHFLVGEDKDLAARVLEGLFGGRALDSLYTLHQKCLVEFENADDVNFNVEVSHKGSIPKESKLHIELWRRPKGRFKIKMHDLVRDMARQIGRRKLPLRLCGSNDKMISNRSRSNNVYVRGIRRAEDEENAQLPFLEFQNIHGLKLLVSPDANILLKLNGLSGDLVWLRVGKCKWSDLDFSRLSLRDLRVLELTDVNLEDFPSLYFFEPPSQRRELTVACREYYETAIGSLRSISSSSSGLAKNSTGSSSDSSSPSWGLHAANRFQAWLEKLNLKNLCKIDLKNIKGMRSLPIKYEKMKNLTHVDLSGCTEIEELPPSFTELSHLQYLALRNCRSLSLDNLGEIFTLEYLDFGGCYSLKQLPMGTTAQRSLKYLNLLDSRMEQLPEDFEQLENLEQLYIGGLFKSFPSSLSNLRKLTELTLIDCLHLCDIKNSVNQLMHLERLRIHGSRIRILPEDIVWMKIKVMDVQHCPIEGECEIGGVPRIMSSGSLQMQGNVAHGELACTAAYREFSSLQSLIIRSTYISKLCIPPAESLFLNLETIDLSDNEHLRAIRGLPGNLVRLNLSYCSSLGTLACLSNLRSLKYLNISGCNGLETLNVKPLRSLEVIEANKCWKLQSIEGVGQLQKLSHIQISTGYRFYILAFPSNISTAIISKQVNRKDFEEARDIEEMKRLVHSYEHVTVRDIPFADQNHFDMQLKYESLEGTIVVCLVADHRCEFEVSLGGRAYNHVSSNIDDGRIHVGRKYGLHMFMWTQDSEALKELKHWDDRPIYCHIWRKSVFSAEVCKEAPLMMGWMVSTKNREFCEGIFNLFIATPRGMYIKVWSFNSKSTKNGVFIFIEICGVSKCASSQECIYFPRFLKDILM